MRTIMFLFLNFYIGIAFCQNKDQEIDPPGTIPLTEDLFVDKAPVTNLMFLEYLAMKNYLSSQGYSSWKSYYVEKKETEWRRGPKKFYPSFLKELEPENGRLSRGGYFVDLRYQNTPVLNITKEQAEDFCQWRTEMVEYAWKFFPKYIGQKKYAEKIQYRLPSREELAEAHNYFSEKDQLVSIKKRHPVRYKLPEVTEAFMRYNISEFTLSDSLFGENYKEIVPTEFPNEFTGFRCVCEVSD